MLRSAVAIARTGCHVGAAQRRVHRLGLAQNRQMERPPRGLPLRTTTPSGPRPGHDDFVDPDPKVQTKRCLEIMLAAVAEAGGSPQDVVRTRMFITDASHAGAVGEAHGEVFLDIRPAATMVVVDGLLDERWKVEMELEAVLTG